MPMNYTSQIKSQESAYHSPEDFFNSLPIVRAIPHSFLMGDNYKVHVNFKELQIEHVASRSRVPAAQHPCMIGLSYMAPVGSLFTTRLDVPLLHNQAVSGAPWAMNSLGDYELKLSRSAIEASSIRLVASARF